MTAYLLPIEPSYYASLLREIQSTQMCRGRRVASWKEQRIGDEMRLRVEYEAIMVGGYRHPVMSYEQPVTFATDAQALMALEE